MENIDEHQKAVLLVLTIGFLAGLMACTTPPKYGDPYILTAAEIAAKECLPTHRRTDPV